MSKSESAEKKPRKKRTYTQAPVVYDDGVPCPHCAHRHNHKVRPGGKKITPLGPRWYMVCGNKKCAKGFVKMILQNEESRAR